MCAHLESAWEPGWEQRHENAHSACLRCSGPTHTIQLASQLNDAAIPAGTSVYECSGAAHWPVADLFLAARQVCAFRRFCCAIAPLSTRACALATRSTTQGGRTEAAGGAGGCAGQHRVLTLPLARRCQLPAPSSV